MGDLCRCIPFHSLLTSTLSRRVTQCRLCQCLTTLTAGFRVNYRALKTLQNSPLWLTAPYKRNVTTDCILFVVRSLFFPRDNNTADNKVDTYTATWSSLSPWMLTNLLLVFFTSICLPLEWWPQCFSRTRFFLTCFYSSRNSLVCFDSVNIRRSLSHTTNSFGLFRISLHQIYLKIAPLKLYKVNKYFFLSVIRKNLPQKVVNNQRKTIK